MNLDITLRSYITIKILLTTYQVGIINKKEFAKAVLDENIKAFMVHFTFFNLEIKMKIYLAYETQIMFLDIKKAFKRILAKYLNFINLFLEDKIIELLNYLDINKYAIYLKIDIQLLYKPINSFRAKIQRLKSKKVRLITSINKKFYLRQLSIF